ncbi:flavodoxin reductase [candidate division WWE3 bacterium]|nr:flavodoxin reductase [candidate division WWE3 bacterium]
MKSFSVKISNIEPVTHDVKRFVVEKPAGFKFVPGQATEVSINLPEWREKKRPFTFTSLNSEEVLEFVIKAYPSHEGVTQKLHTLEPGAEILIGEPWGTINYSGKGVFLAGGAGVTPFIAIFRDLHKKGQLEGNKLIFSNKTDKDVILEKELREYFGDAATFVLTDQENVDASKYEKAYIDKEYLSSKISDFSQKFYVCGPPGFVKAMRGSLTDLGASSDEVVFEK